MKMSQQGSLTARKLFADNSLLSDHGGERERIVVPILESEYRGTLTSVFWLRLRIVRTV